MLHLLSAIQGDLFSEAPKPSVSEDKKAVNESAKSTAQAAGERAVYVVKKCMDIY